MPSRIFGVVLLAVLAAACSEDGTTTGGGPTGPGSPTVTSVTLTGTLAIGNIGQTSQMTATAHFAKGTTQDVTTDATWTSSDAAVATISKGLVTATGVGSATITATYQNVSGSTRVTVTRPPTYLLNGLVTESVPHTTTPIAGVRVEFTDGANKGKFALTDTSGRYQMTDVQAGSGFTVRASATGYNDASKQVAIGDNGVLDFTLVPTLQQVSQTLTRQISGGDAGCPGSGGLPCQTFDLPLHNTGAFTATLTWGNDASLALQLYSVDTQRVLMEAAASDTGRQVISGNMSTPGNYQLRVIAQRISVITSITINTTHTN